METILIPGCEEGEVPVTMFECNDRTIQSIGHNASSNRLCVRFKNGLLHVYPGVAPGFFERFCTAPSKSAFWETYIQGDLESAPSPNGWRIAEDDVGEIDPLPMDHLRLAG